MAKSSLSSSTERVRVSSCLLLWNCKLPVLPSLPFLLKSCVVVFFFFVVWTHNALCFVLLLLLLLWDMASVWKGILRWLAQAPLIRSSPLSLRTDSTPFHSIQPGPVRFGFFSSSFWQALLLARSLQTRASNRSSSLHKFVWFYRLIIIIWIIKQRESETKRNEKKNPKNHWSWDTRKFRNSQIVSVCVCGLTAIG